MLLRLMPYNTFYFYILCAGVAICISSQHWVGMWVGLELNLLGFLPIALGRGGKQRANAVMMYFIVQALGTSLLLFGTLMTYPMTLSWDIMAPRSCSLEPGSICGVDLVMGTYGWLSGLSTMPDLIYKLGGFLIFSGLLLKLGVFPFHFWVPPLMWGLSWWGCILGASWQKIAPMYLLGHCYTMRLMEPHLSVYMFAYGCGIASVYVGGVGGVNQLQVRSLMGYSSISHGGWLVVAAYYGKSVMEQYLFLYVIISFFAMGVLWDKSVRDAVSEGWYDEGIQTGEMTLMCGLASLSGIPPFLGFAAKWSVVVMGMHQGDIIPMAAMVVGSLPTIYYLLVLGYYLIMSSNTMMYIQHFGLEAGGEDFSTAASLLCLNLVATIVFLKGF